MSGLLLDVLYDTNKEEMIKNLLLESKIFGVTIFGDGATITNVPLINILAASPNNPFALLEIVDCTDQMAKGGKKDAKYLLGIVRLLVRWLEACRRPSRYVPYKGTFVLYDSTFGASDQGQTLDV
jgi:hypothetical protein